MAMGRVLPQVVFTIAWLSCSTYLIASFSYRNTDYIIQHSDVYLANMVMYVCCVITSSLAITGCMCLKANVTHVCCIALFCLLICALIPTTCIYGLVRLKQARKINERYVKNEVVQHYQTHNELSPLLIAVQRDQGCCGLYSSIDYREFIYPRDKCRFIKQDIPESCLRLNEIYKHCSKSKKIVACSVQMYLENAIVFKDVTMNQELTSKRKSEEERSQYKCANATSKNAMLSKKKSLRVNAYWKNGCMSTIIENSMDLRDTHYFFFYLMMIFGVVMLASFLTHWFETVPTRLVNDDTASMKAVKTSSSRNSSQARRAKPGAQKRPIGKGV